MALGDNIATHGYAEIDCAVDIAVCDGARFLSWAASFQTMSRFRIKKAGLMSTENPGMAKAVFTVIAFEAMTLMDWSDFFAGIADFGAV